MAFINVAEWQANNVSDWLKGLDDCILPYVHFFLNNNINGCRLLLLSCDDLNHLNVCKVGHQELILEAVDLLKHLHYNFGSETLQSLALRLGCKARSLFNQLKNNQLSQTNDCDNIYNNDERVSTPTLSAVSDILAAVKSFISWIDRYPFEGQDQYIPVRKTILRLSIELASTAQRDQFVEKPNDVIKKSCITLAELCDRIVQELNDSLAIQPAVLDIVTVKKKPEEELGMHIHSSYSGIHIVGGIKFQSPSHRCGRIEEGDEIIQVSYQTVVGWQLKKLVNSMKEHPTEILLTIKKRPRHSNIMGQVIVLKPYKIPSRKSGHRSGGNRVKNAATTTTGSGDDDDAFLQDEKHPKPVYQLYPRRPKLQVRRRATISGASPTICQPPIRIEDLVVNMDNKKEKKESINRSISHDSSNHLKSRGLSVDVTSTQVPFVVNNNNTNSNTNTNTNTNSINSNINNNNIKPLSSCSPKLPYAKVHPFPMEAKPNPILKKSENETTPKKIMPSKHSLDKEQQNSINSNKEEEQNLVENKKTGATQVGVVNPSPVTVSTYQLISDIDHKPNSNQNNCKRKEQINKLLKSPLMNRSNFPTEPQTIQNSLTPVLRPNSKARNRHSTRRVSCKDLGEGDCQGWLYQRKEQHGFLGSSSRWTKRWVVLKNNYLYCYKDTNEVKAECLIHLPGFTVSPAPECKSKKYAFKLYNPNTAFHFASDSQLDMSKWMNKMGLAAISYMTHNDLQPEAFCYSETEESEDGLNSPSINRNAHRFGITSNKSAIGYREASPAGLSTSSSDTNNSIREELYGRSRLASTSSSSTTSNSSSFHDLLPKSIRKSDSSQVSASPIPKSPLIQNRINYVRSASCLDANDILTTRNRRQLSDSSGTRYAKIVFPHSQNPKGSFSPQIPPRGLRIAVNSTPDSGSLDRQRFNVLKDITTGTVSKVTNSYNNLQQEADNEVNKRQPQPPQPLPRTSKLTNRRENVLPGFVSKMTDNFDQRNKPLDSTTPSIMNSPPTRPVPKPCEQSSDRLKDEKVEQNDDTYEYVFRPTMAMIKTGIVNPLYERVQNKSWSGEMPSPNSTGKGRMPLPNELQQKPNQQNSEEIKSSVNKTVNQSPNELSFLDREYNRLYGVKKPNERLSPKNSVPPYVPKSATSVEIENLYTSKPRTTSSSSIGTTNIDEMQFSSPTVRERPQTPSSSDNSMSSSSGISSYYSTYLEIPAEQMYRIMNKRQTSTSSYHSAKSSPTPSDCRQTEYQIDDKPNAQQITSLPLSNTSNEGWAQNSQKPNKSPTKSSSFRLFSSPKLLKKFSTPKYHKERHLEKRDVNKLTTDEKQSKTGRLFLGSPKLTRALFGSSSKKAQTLPPEPVIDDSCDNQKVDTTNSSQNDNSFHSKQYHLNRSSSDSSVTSNPSAFNQLHHHIVEKKLNKPNLTIALPLLTESSDSCEMPLTPETPRKPTMGIAMIGKRRPSNVGSDKSSVELALQQHYGSGSQTNPSTDYATEDTDDEWAHIVRTIEEAGLTLETDKRPEQKTNALAKPIDDEKLCHLVLSLRAFQRTLKPEKQQEIEAIDELLNQPISVDILEEWIKKYPYLLPKEYY